MIQEQTPRQLTISHHLFDTENWQLINTFDRIDKREKYIRIGENILEIQEIGNSVRARILKNFVEKHNHTCDLMRSAHDANFGAGATWPQIFITGDMVTIKDIYTVSDQFVGNHERATEFLLALYKRATDANGIQKS